MFFRSCWPVACNLINNLPAGLIAGSAVAVARVPNQVANAVLVGVDLGPNLSVTESLATILWLTSLRLEGIPGKAQRRSIETPVPFGPCNVAMAANLFEVLAIAVFR
jgi:hypothetical protein